MVKVISLSENAFRKLRSLKSKDESYSDLIISLVERKNKNLMGFAGIMKDVPSEKIKSNIKKWRYDYARY